jgi:HlyD family secretion protein
MTVRRYVTGVSSALIALVSIFGTAVADSEKNVPVSKEVGATGTIEPRGGMVMISGVPGAAILAIKAQVGQTVKRGDVLMVLDGKEARLDADLASLALDQTHRRARQAQADEATALALAQDRAQRAERDARAYRELGPNATSQRQISSYDAAAAEAGAALAVERRKSAQVRADSAADVLSANKRYALSQAKLAAYRVTAPSDGVILEVTQHVGEVLGGSPAIEIGDISSMYVTCNAFQGDLLKISPGMRATVSSNAFARAMTGRVEWVGRLIQTKSQTGQFKVKLDDPAMASRLVGMEVNVKVSG